MVVCLMEENNFPISMHNRDNNNSNVILTTTADKQLGIMNAREGGGMEYVRTYRTTFCLLRCHAQCPHTICSSSHQSASHINLRSIRNVHPYDKIDRNVGIPGEWTKKGHLFRFIFAGAHKRNRMPTVPAVHTQQQQQPRTNNFP